MKRDRNYQYRVGMSVCLETRRMADAAPAARGRGTIYRIRANS